MRYQILADVRGVGDHRLEHPVLPQLGEQRTRLKILRVDLGEHSLRHLPQLRVAERMGIQHEQMTDISSDSR